MSLFEFGKAEALVARQIPFRSLIMAAIRVGDGERINKLKAEWPDIYMEVQERLNDERNYTIPDKPQTNLRKDWR